MNIWKIVGRVVLALVSLAVLVYVGAVVHFLQTAEPSYVMICAGGNGFRIPRQVCREWIYAFRGTPEDVEAFRSNVGIDWVFELPREDWEKMARFWTEKGVDINHRDPLSSMTALQGVAAEGDADKAAILLKLGADPTILDAQGLTALERAERALARNPGDPRYVAMVDLLKAAMGRGAGG